jgi:hypothetical protein
MTTPSEQRRDSRHGQNGKRKYEPPEIESQEVFETTALACGKLPAQGGACVANKKTS